MNIVLDARWIFEQSSGIGRYTRELIRHLLALESKHQWTLLFDDAKRAERLRNELGMNRSPSARAEIVLWPLFHWKDQTALPRRLRARQADVYHAPNWWIPYLAFSRRRHRRAACIVTIHDLIPLMFPQFTPRARKTQWFPLFRRLFHETLRRADRIIVPSETTRRDVLDFFHVSESDAARVAVIPEAADERFRPAERGAVSDPTPTILYVGRRDPYKNLALLVEAFALVRAALPKVQLCVIGPPDPRYPEAERTAARLGIEDVIQWRGHVAFDELVTAYQQAAVFAMPSRYEGFGLPVLEAMACGAPVVCSDTPALVELAGGAALHSPVNDRGALADALLRVLRDPALAADLHARGLARAAAFSWRATASATLAVYETAARRNGDRRCEV